jgi:hypothetical protein
VLFIELSPMFPPAPALLFAIIHPDAPVLTASA